LTRDVARLFVAVWPPQKAVAALLTLPREQRAGVRYVPMESWHVTVRFFGEADAQDVMGALAGTDLPPSTARLGPEVERLFKGVLGVPVDGLAELADVVSAATAQLGDRPSPRFVGHLTIARHKPRSDVRGLVHAPVDVAFDVGEVALVESRIDQRGASYETLTTWPVG
jgi:2'-5' RNA ligase